MTADQFVKLAALAVTSDEKEAGVRLPAIRRHVDLANYFLARTPGQRAELLERIAHACATTLVTCSP